MLYIIILFLMILFFLIYRIVFRIIQKRKNRYQKIEIKFEDIDSLNVSKIIIDENDIDFVRNEFWYQYKQKQILNENCFNRLKKHFEKENNLKITEFEQNELQNEIETIELINLITSDTNSKEDIAAAFCKLEKLFILNKK